MQNKITLGALVICVLLSDSSLYLLHRWIEWFNQSQRQKSMMNHLQGLYSLPQEHEMIINSKDIESQIDLVSVGSRDALTGFWVLKDIHLSIKSGETIAISSQNQAASSQLLKIMAGILPPTQGHVLISNQDLYGDYLHTLRSHIAYLPHHGTLFAGTILDNITMFRNSQLAKEAKQIANKLGLDTLINTLPMGYQTHVGFGASDHIARGIKQLIIIARGLIGNPKIILFDEANTALDQMADEHLRHYLNECKKHITIVLVSHRSSFLALVDKTLVLDQIKTSVIESSEVA